MLTKYTFIHPTKSGGTAVEQYFQKYYSHFIQGRGHGNTCINSPNPIIIVRDVYSRFLSMFKYWKRGATTGRYMRDENWNNTHALVTIRDFIHMIQTNDPRLNHTFTEPIHFQPTTFWIKNCPYKKIIIIRYQNNMNDTIQSLIQTLGLPKAPHPLPFENVSVQMEEDELKLDDYARQFIQDYFREDLHLIRTIQSQPELFKLVV